MTLTAVAVARKCPNCGAGDIAPHCGSRTCPWDKCDLCGHTTHKTSINDIIDALEAE